MLVVSTMISLMMADTTQVPFGQTPMVNGFEGEKEWDNDAVANTTIDNTIIKLQQDSQYMYVLVKNNDTLHTGLDLYLDDLAGNIRILHISSAHGQKIFKDGAWVDLAWGNQQEWTSNLVESIYEDGKQNFLAPEIFEFQIDKKLIPSEKFRLMFHLKRPEKWIPVSVDTVSSDNWLEFVR